MTPSATKSRTPAPFPGGILHSPAGEPGKEELFAALAHDLRTPLNLALLLASDGATNPDLPPATRADFEAISRHVQVESRLIDDLLGSPALKSSLPAVQMQALSLHKILGDALESVRPEFDARHIPLPAAPHGEGPLVWGDPTRLRKVFSNVLSNAAAFTPESGRVGLLTRVDPGRGAAVVEISDTGVGLTEGELAALSGTQGTEKTPGSDAARRAGALGLALSRMFLEMHSGRISASSPGRGKGSTFAIELPLHGTSLPPEKGGAAWPLTSERLQATKKAGASRGRLLLVEDHAPTRETLAKLLGRRHYDVLAASSVAEARSVAASGDPQVVISDIGLPDGNGYSLMAELRAGRPGLTGIALSGYGMEEDVERSLQAGFSAHLVKPVTINAIEEALSRIPVGAS